MFAACLVYKSLSFCIASLPPQSKYQSPPPHSHRHPSHRARDLSAMTSPSPVLWTPSDPASSQTFQFRQHINSKYNLSLSSYEDLWRWSCDHRSDFWSEVWDWERIIGVKGGGPFVDESARPVDNPLWFQGAKLNWAENQLRHVASRPNDVAVYQTSEHCAGWTPAPKSVTYQSLYDLVTKCQAGMKRAGLVKGDRVAFWGGTCLEAVVVLLATSSIGAIFSSAAADFGVDGVIERLEQVSRVECLSATAVCGALVLVLMPSRADLMNPCDRLGCFERRRSNLGEDSPQCYSFIYS